MRHLLWTLDHALDREADLWMPFIPDDAQMTSFKLRSKIVVWLAALNDKFNFSEETLFLSVNIFDRFLLRVKAQTKYVRCIAITCLYLAAKVTEEDEIIPLTHQLVGGSGCGYSEAEVLRMERCILGKLDWNLKASATSIEFIHLLHALLLEKCPDLINTTPDIHLPILSQTLFHCLPHTDLLDYSPSTLALAVLSLYLQITFTHWRAAVDTLKELTRIDADELKDCQEQVSDLVGSHLLDTLRSNMTKLFPAPPPRPTLAVSPPPVCPGGGQSEMELSSTSGNPLSSPFLAIAPPVNKACPRPPARTDVGYGEKGMDLSTPSSSSGTLVHEPPSLPVTPDPPAKRRRLEDEDEMYVHQESLRRVGSCAVTQR
jgi:hypothetical protein